MSEFLILADEEYAAAVNRARSNGGERQEHASVQTAKVARGFRSPRQGDKDYTPNERSFCRCGFTFVPVLDANLEPTKQRRCPSCGTEERRERRP